MAKTSVPVVEGWFTMDAAAPHLCGSRCSSCGSYFFPVEKTRCRNPRCAATELESVELSNRGRLWSYTNNCYKPPPPYVAAEPFAPYTLAAVELEREKMVILGQVTSGVEVAALKVGMEMELVLETLFADDQQEHVVWKWKPLA